MSGGSSDQTHTASLQRCRRLHWGVVAAIWGLAALWITINPLTGDHANTTSRWMQNVTLLLVSGACTMLVAWLMQQLVIEPQRNSVIDDRKFELGYYAGRADTLNELRVPDDLHPPLGLVPTMNGTSRRIGS